MTDSRSRWHPCAALVLALWLAGCGGGSAAQPDGGGGADAGGGTDAGLGADAGPDGAAPGLPVGAACTQDDQCSGAAPDCLTADLAPLASFAASTNPTAQLLAEQIVIPLPAGYCSNVAPCATDADCGNQGRCFLPLVDVPGADYQSLIAALGLSTEETATLAAFHDYGQCLKPCTGPADCTRPGYVCAVPLESFVSLLADLGGRLETYCIGTAVDPCAPNPCVHGTCSAGDGDTAVCACDAGWVGARCDQVDPCAPNPCAHGAGCTSDGAAFTCQCPSGWIGTLCDVDDPCLPDPCLHHGTCALQGTSAVCSGCDAGWSGDRCDVPYDCGDPGGVSAPLHVDVSGGTLLGAVATYSCDASYVLDGDAQRTCTPAGWSGAPPTCAAAPVHCQTDSCSGHGTCVEVAGVFDHCDCDPGWSGGTCATQVDCGAPPAAPAHGTASYTATTYGATASYGCDAGYQLAGSATLTCLATGLWSGAAPTCAASYCDVVYQVTGTFRVSNAPASCGNVTKPVTTNATTPALTGGATTPFTAGSAFKGAFIRLRFPDGGGHPSAGAVALIEYYLPIEFTVACTGTNVLTDVDHSVGLLALTGSPPAIPASPTLSRPCQPWASGTLAGTALAWDTCTPVPPASGNGWSPDNAVAAPGDTGCAMRMSVWGNVSCSGALCGFVPSLGNERATWDQFLNAFTFSQATDYATATFTMTEVQVPEATSESQTRTWVAITSATPFHVECGTAATLTCDEQAP